MSDTPYDQTIRSLVRGAYDIQDLRVRTGNRLMANFRSKLGIEPDEQADDENEELLDQLERDYEQITDGVASITARRSFDYEGIISSYVELRMVDHFVKLKNQETRVFRDIERALSDIDIWTEFLEDVTGVGPAMAGCIVSEFDPYEGTYPSSFWAYAGLDVVDGEARSAKESHLKEVEYTDSEGNTKTKKSLGYNPFIKSKLLGVMGPSFLRTGSWYRKFYDDYRNRKENDADWEDATDAHLHRASIRYMVKQFVIDLHVKWRDLEDLPVSQPYHVAKLGKDDHGREERLGVEDPKRLDGYDAD